MNLILYKIIAAILIFLMSMLAVIYPLKRKKTHPHPESLQLGEALASGIFMGAAFFHMLPEAIHQFAQINSTITYPFPEMICLLGFLLLLFLERLSLCTHSAQSRSTLPYLLVTTLVIHSLTEGAALGNNVTLSETVMLFVAILAHKGSESFALCVILLRHDLSIKRVLTIVILLALMTPLGIAMGTTVTLFAYEKYGELTSALFNAFAAGTFLYISTLHHIHFHQHREDAQGLLEFASLLFGTVIMGVIAWWV